MSVLEKLYDWQLRIVDKFANREAFGYFLDMGLGKTPIAIASAEKTMSTKVIVISVNAKATESRDVKYSWLWWASQSNMNYELLDKFSKAKDFDVNKNQLLLINYEAIFKRTQRLTLHDQIKAFIKSCKGHNVTMILDESHRVKNISSKTTKSIMQIKRRLNLVSKSLHTYLLTGTPFTKGYIDLYSQMKLLGYTSSKSTFVDHFCVKGNVPGLKSWEQPIVGYKNVQMLYRELHKYAVTIKSEEVVDLPDKIFIDHVCSVSEDFIMLTRDRIKQSKLLSYLEHRDLLSHYEIESIKDKDVNNPIYRNLSFPEFDWFADVKGVFWMRSRQISIGFQGDRHNYKWFDKSRLEKLSKFLKDNELNYVCFYNYVPELFELYNIFEKEGYLIDVYSGDIKSLYHYTRFENMTEDERLGSDKRVIIANYASGSTGKNWQLYNHVIQFSIPLFNHYSQSIKRLHRLGQEKTVFYHRFYQDNWLDKGMLKSLDEQITYDVKMFESDKRVHELKIGLGEE